MNLSNCERSASILALIASSALLVGCDQRSDSTKAVRAGSQNLYAIGVAPGTGTSKAEGRLRDVATQVQPAATNGNDGEKAAAALLTAQTMRGQGEIAATNAKNVELQIRNKVTLVRAAIDDWSRRNAVAAAADAFSPAKDIQRLQENKAKKQQELVAEQKRLADAQAQMASLEQLIKAKVDAAAAQSDQYTALIQTTVKLTATQAADVVTKANEFRRKADDLRTEGGKLQSQADLLKPVVKEITLLSETIQNQIKNSDETVKSLNARADAAKKEAKDARDAATIAANDADKFVIEIVELRFKALAEAYTSALDSFSKAAGKANAAANAAAGKAKVTAGSAKLSTAETQWAKANGARGMASLFDSLVGTQPKLPNDADYVKKSDEAKAEAKAALEAATAAIDEAKTAFDSARIQDKSVKERMTKLGELLGKAKEIASGAAIDQPLPAPDAPAATAVVDGQPAGVAATDTALSAAIDKALGSMQAGKMSELAAMSNVSTGNREALTSLLGAQDNLMAADQACRAKFKQSAVQVLSTLPGAAAGIAQMGGGQVDLEKLRTIKSSDLKIAVSGDNATATSDALPQPLRFVKKDGAWLYDVSAVEPMLAMPQMKMGASMGAVMKQWADDINAGKYADAATAAQGFLAAVMPLMQQMMAPPK